MAVTNMWAIVISDPWQGDTELNLFGSESEARECYEEHKREAQEAFEGGASMDGFEIFLVEVKGLWTPFRKGEDA